MLGVQHTHSYPAREGQNLNMGVAYMLFQDYLRIPIEKKRVRLCAFAHHKYCLTRIFTAKLTGCQNTVINGLPGSLINCHICQSNSNYSYFYPYCTDSQACIHCTDCSVSRRLHMIDFRLRLLDILRRSRM